MALKMKSIKKMNSYIFYDEEKELMLNVYEHKEGGICRYTFLEGPVFKQSAAYISMKRDLTECIESVKYLDSIKNEKTIPQVVKTSLLFSSIVRYAKCFTSGEGRGTSLNKADVFKGDRAPLLEFHETTMDLRNKYLAHAGNSKHESRALIAILNPNLEKKTRETITYAGFRLKDDDSNIENYLNLFHEVLSHVDGKVEKLREISNQKADEIGIDKLYELSKEPNPDKFIPFDVNLV